jgi:hypothetical protein
MKKLHKRDKITAIQVEPNEGGRTLLCSNESDQRSPSLDLINNTAAEYELIKNLSEILVEGFLWHYEHANGQQTSGDLLPGFD